MFGYISINKPELKIREYEEYRGFYCGLCHSLKRYGQLSRLSLNYDMTFLSVLLTALYEPDTIIEDYHCPLHPLTKEKVYKNKYIDYCADMTIILAYYKNLDDIEDENKTKSKVFNFYLKKAFNELRSKYGKQCQNIEKALANIKELEISKSNEIDYLASASGKMLGEVFSYGDDHWTNDLYNIGFYLGKFVYILDAYDDRQRDKEKQCFNIINNLDYSKEYVVNVLEMMMGECAQYFERLPIIEYAGILRNIIYSGAMGRMNEMEKK